MTLLPSRPGSKVALTTNTALAPTERSEVLPSAATAALLATREGT